MNKDTFLTFLPILGFERKGTTFFKSIGKASLAVDVAKGEFIFPEDQGLKIHQRTTCNFSQDENFVVFECVHRLLLKGYKPSHLELEPRWQLGHGASGGRADILIRDNAGKCLLIIECKIAGREFDRAWKETLIDGGQLFGYVEQERSTQFLCLYTSSIEGGSLHYQNHIIAHRDNEKYLTDKRLKGFKDATDRKERFAVWRDVYKLAYTASGIFEGNIQPYQIGAAKMTAAALKPISASDQQKKYHEFATILRQHNVSGRENAFDKLVNLFLCKLVDETEYPEDLKFSWRGVAYDNHFDLLDRLQLLYQQGMGKFLGEVITYINEADVQKALRFIRGKPDATQRAVWGLFMKQKFYTNNDFSFIDVHNEKLFYKNSDVLLKVIQMWQDIRLVDETKHNQFLGDMFEGFLDQGVKQSEGQYFTPMPICRFMLMSLPLSSLVKGVSTPPKAIDYACGAGHFLTELALQIKPLVAEHYPKRTVSSYHESIIGIEKEYRLSKIAKVSAFMYGQPGICICYGDALLSKQENYPQIQDGTFDLLIANPPFSVRGFLATLPEWDRSRYRLTETINDLDTANAIETFFVERAAQLLKSGGIASIILPSSMLQKGDAAYVRAREILLQCFDILGIAEFASGTFGKTGTNTVMLFLRRKPSGPDSAEHYKERIEDWFKGSLSDKRAREAYRDTYLIAAYASHTGIPLKAYKTLLLGRISKELLRTELFESYRKQFFDSTEIKNLKVKKQFKQLAKVEQQRELMRQFVSFITPLEKDKLLHFILAHRQSQSVVIMRSPTGNAEMRKMLGYEWSGKKGDEGIKIWKDEHGRHDTPLYDETSRDNSQKINYLFSRNLSGQTLKIHPQLKNYVSIHPLKSLIDYGRVSFDKEIYLAPREKITIKTKWPLKKLGSITKVINGGTPDTDDPQFWKGGTICWATLVDTKLKYLKDTKRKITESGLRHCTLLPLNSVIFSSRATIGEVCINKVRTATNQGYKSFICNPKEIDFEYLYYLLLYLRSTFEALIPPGSKYREINGAVISEFKIPVPPIKTGIQKKIVKECMAIDASGSKLMRNGIIHKQIPQEMEKMRSDVFLKYL